MVLPTGTKTASDGTTAGEYDLYNVQQYLYKRWFPETAVFLVPGAVQLKQIENNSRALVYNNLIVNCDFGVRIASGPGGAKVYLADTTYDANSTIKKTTYGYNFYYGDNAAICRSVWYPIIVWHSP